MSQCDQLADRTEMGSTEYRDGQFRLVLPALQTGSYQCSIQVPSASLRACVGYRFKRVVMELEAIEARFW